MAIPFSHKGLQKLSLNAKIPIELWVKPRQREIRQKAAKATAECPVQSLVPLAVLCTTPLYSPCPDGAYVFAYSADHSRATKM